jgi:hypothetical protein
MRNISNRELLIVRQRAACDRFQAVFSAMTSLVIATSANGHLFTTTGAVECDRLAATVADAEQEWHSVLRALGCDPPPTVPLPTSI